MVRIVKRTDLTGTQSVVFRVVAVILALISSGAFIYILGHNPVEVYTSMLKGAFGSKYKILETIKLVIPLVITSLGIAVAFRMKFWNIGAEGQILMGAFCASFFALKFPDMPKPLLLTVMLIAGVIGGGIWGAIPAFFKANFGTNETLFTLMMNYIAIKWITYLQYGPWKDPKANNFPKIPNFSDNAVLPKLLGVHIGWVFALLLIVVMYIFINHTKKGYEISVIGESENTARYAGMNVKNVIITAMFISGGLCGLTGMIQASAVSGTLAETVSGGVGNTAIITTWLSQLNAPVTLLVSLLFAILVQGGSYIQTAFQIPQSAAQILQGMILFFVLGSEFFIQYKLVLSKGFGLIQVKKEGV